MCSAFSVLSTDRAAPKRELNLLQYSYERRWLCAVTLHEAIGLGACEHGKPAVHHPDAVYRTELEVAVGHESAHVPQQGEDIPDQRQARGGWDGGRSHAVFLARPCRRRSPQLVASVGGPHQRVPRTLSHGGTCE